MKISHRFLSLDRTRFLMDRQTDEQYVSPRMGQNINMMTDFTYAHMLDETTYVHMLDETMTPVDQWVKHWSTVLVVPSSS